MKNLFLIIFFSTFGNICFAQITNGGFENWEPLGNYDKPFAWNTNQNSQYDRFIKDTISTEGDFSLKIDPTQVVNGWHGECMSYAQTSFSLQSLLGDSMALTFNVKSIPYSNDLSDPVIISVNVNSFTNGNFETINYWTNYNSIKEFIEMQVPISNPNADSLEIEILGGAENFPADGCIKSSFTWIDDMRIEKIKSYNSISEQYDKKNTDIIYNHESNAIQVIPAIPEFSIFQIFNHLGQLTDQGKFNGSSIKLKRNQNSLFILKLMDSNHSKEITKKFNIEKN